MPPSWLDEFDKVVVLAIVVIVHPLNLGLIKRRFWKNKPAKLLLMKKGFGRAGQPVNTSGGNHIKTNL
jgi:hypothetical protein